MKSLLIVSGLLIAAAACGAQTYQPRVNFGARLEPQGVLMHGAGQSTDAFAAYTGIFPAGRQPMVYMYYTSLAGLTANWSDDLKAQLMAYPNVFLIPQIGLNLTFTNADGTLAPYDAQIAAGAYDAQIANLVTGLQRLATPAYIRIGYEFNGLSWNGYTPVPYQQAFIRIANAIRAANLEVATVWDASEQGVTNYFDYYPGDQYVDWFGMNIFNADGFTDSNMNVFFVQANARKKPVMIGETTPAYVGAQNGATSWNGWFVQFFNFMATTPVVKEFNYIDWNWPVDMPSLSFWGDARLETDAATYVRNLYVPELADPMILNAGSETAFRKLLAGSAGSTPPPAVTDLSAMAAANGVVLAWTPVADPSGIARYYIYRDNAFLDVWLGSGYVDTTVEPNAEHSYTVAAMDRAGNLAVPSNVATATVTSVEMLWNGNFENGLAYWASNSYAAGAVGTAVASTANPIDGTASAMLTVSSSTGTAWHLQFLQGFKMTQGMTYTVSFKARSSAPVSLPLMIQLASSPNTVYLGPTAAVTTNASLFQYAFVAPVSAAVNMSFEYGNINPNTVWLDDVSIKESTNASLGASGWQLVWSDEFNGAAGTPPDPAKWNYDLGAGGWGNGEIETYTNSPNNVFQDGSGNLVIRAIKDTQGNYTSARLQTGSPGASTHTADLSWKYGLIEARIKLPFGKGVWPAFWMLGENYGSVNWPTCGEVDIMENFGTYANNSSVNNGSIHGPASSSASPAEASAGGSVTLPFGETVYDDYHVYAVVWSEDSIEFFVDGSPYETLGPSWLPVGAPWVFNSPFYLILNLAIGGPTTILGTPDASVTFPQDMLVDYVRIYQPVSMSATTPEIAPASVVNGASYLGAISPGALASVFGTNMAGTAQMAPLTNGIFPTTVASTTVSVNGVNAALVYVSPTQINFQIPWETAPGPAVPVTVTWNGVTSAPENVTITVASPSFFLSEYVNGTAWVTGAVADGCATYSSECAVKAGSIYQLWVNGLGPKTAALQDGVPAPLEALQVPGGPDSCQLTIGGQPAKVWYCGVAPGEIIDQVNFTYPAGVSTSAAYTNATMTVNGVTIHFRVPAPAAK
jgi:uncharacterized protein (TIGR03437 family)